ncbi:alpha-1,3-mannosyl-glycoprotein 4-beta-N-acetylglucosaminyltransferase A isoform X3 [Dunckerocampus dactyliophorus]|uniref:alpha-1,3-mannosyl-glycoprotein 4-beta-N-acetylglucosaminyltransferase A isoform X3 n=1 Tax=Dunckerocampus dactyliophorus TaxID=161453 RepID=UPI0024059217|nr:alpha-1,3-mannosyl-glycoprotein 4-beta-N-acetylglucosaminyltransferase A isoform X3 [Dunckerocampus dactyliophorus]
MHAVCRFPFPALTWREELEDDIVAKPNYFATMKNFALQLASEDWMVLEFSQLGFIGKMFQAPDLNFIVEFIFMFYKEKPIDWLLDHILWVKVCNPEKDAKHCERQKSSLRVRFRPSLFQHVGLHSSLAGKIQKLTDKDFLKPLLHKMHVNPPAEVSTSMKVYQGHTLEKTYLGEDFFWAITPKAGDYMLFKFDRPVSIERFLFRSGNPEHPGDKMQNTTVEILPVSETGLQTKEMYKRTEDRFYRIEGNDLEYRTVIRDFVSWSELNQLQLNTSKTKEMIINVQKKTSHFTPVNIQGADIELVDSYKFLGVHLNNKLDWSVNTHALYKKGQSRLHLLRRLRSFGVCRTLLRTFYDSVVASAIFYAVGCWRGGSTDRDRSRINRLIRRASSVLDGPLDSVEEVGERRMLAKLTSIMDNTSHPLHDTVGSLSSSFSRRLLHPRCKKERFRRSFIPTAVRLYNTCTT